MKVLDLSCRLGHVFEGWFGSEADFQDQKQRGLVQCPLCSDDHIEKRLSAPRLNLGARPPVAPAAASEPSSSSSSAPSEEFAGATSSKRGLATTTHPPSSGAQSHAAPALTPELQAAWLDMARKIVANTEDVGSHFAEEARRMHHGEVPERAIRGNATAGEAVQLLEEGIAVMPLPLPVAAKETLQ
jgi:hypothetical protein